MAELKLLIPPHEIETGAWNQINYLESLDFVKKIVILPDVHQGYLMPVGSVALMDGVISPEGVGSDEGCGMLFYPTGMKAGNLTPTDIEGIYNDLVARIPTGFNSRKTSAGIKPPKLNLPKDVEAHVHQKMDEQLGTLGGGNHFIEIGCDTNWNLSVVIHSGSRNPGKTVADYWFQQSKEQDTHLPDGFLDWNSLYGQQFYNDLLAMQDFALENRMVMLREVLDVLGIKTQLAVGLNVFNETHNHAIPITDGILHRKGATPAESGQIGVIPGNMRDGTYITKGLGNVECLMSASHGAGRKMSRGQAKKNCTLEQFQEDMVGIKARVEVATFDENPRAYKDLEEVIKRQEGIVVDVIDHITPIINIKG